MSKLPYMQFYPSDWLRDPALRAVSPAAKGVWIDLLCLMWQAPERGVLRLVSDSNPNARQIANMLGLKPNVVQKLIAELEESGVLSRTDDGAICSRRMVRDEELRREAKQNGAKGGNPKLLQGDNPPLNPPGYPPPYPPSEILQKLYVRSQKTEREALSPPSSSSAQTSEQEASLSVELPTEPPHIAEQLDAAANELIVTWNGLRGVKRHARNWLSSLERGTLERWMFGDRRVDWRAMLKKFPLAAFPPDVDGGFQPTLGWLMQEKNWTAVLDGLYDFKPGQKPQAASPRTRVRLGELEQQGASRDQN